jgi:hypothetical protein
MHRRARTSMNLENESETIGPFIPVEVVKTEITP